MPTCCPAASSVYSPALTPILFSRPQKPNDIVNWIRKHYPSEWDGDEGRCSAHRVRTYLARKGADMYYEKLNQGCIAGWRIRQNHLWRFENGGFQGRGMKQEEAIAQAQKENEAIATAAHKAAAAEALAAGHPGIKTSMSQAGVNDGTQSIKRQRTKGNGQARRKIVRAKVEDGGEMGPDGEGDHSFYQDAPSNEGQYQQSTAYNQAGPSNGNPNPGNGIPIDPTLMSATQGQGDSDNPVDMQMVQQAMQAAAAANAGQMDELDMGMQLPIEMQMHGGEHDEGTDDRTYPRGPFGQYQQGHHPYTPHQQQGQYEGGQYGYTGGQGQVYGRTGYQEGGR